MPKQTVLLFFLLSHMAFAGNVKQSSLDFAIQDGVLEQNGVQYASRLSDIASVSEEHVRLFGPNLKSVADRAKLVEMKIAMHMRVPTQIFLDQKFWGFDNAAMILKDVVFTPIKESTFVMMTYPVRDKVANRLLAKTISCTLRQDLIAPASDEYRHVLNIIGKDLDQRARPDLIVRQLCANYSMMFENSVIYMALYNQGDKTKVISLQQFYLKKTTFDQLKQIPFLNIENKIAGTILSEMNLTQRKFEESVLR